MLVALTIVSAASCALLVVAEWRTLPALRVVSKLVASAAFVMIGVQAMWIAHDPVRSAFGQWILAGLVFGAIGDAALLGRGKRWFLAGLVAFLLGHLGYVVAVTYVEPASTWLALAGFYAALPVVAGAAAFVVLWPKLGSMKLPVALYVITIVAMVIAALAVARGATIPAPQRQRFLVGAALFFVSDLAVARDRFIARSFTNKLWGLPAYYAGQLLIAWSVVGL